MKKILGILLLTICVSSSVFAKEITRVCASHILVPSEMDAIKLKSQIKTYEDFKYYARIYLYCCFFTSLCSIARIKIITNKI